MCQITGRQGGRIRKEVKRMNAQMRQRAEKAFKKLFQAERVQAAVGIFLCLHAGDALPKKEFGGVSIEEVREAAKIAGLDEEE